MRSSLNFTNKLNMISEMENDSIFQILEYDKLNGASNAKTALGLNIIGKSGIKLKQIRIVLDDSSVKVEPGALSYMKGNITIRNKTGGVLGFGKKLISSKLTKETVFKPTYSGSGEIFLEPSFSNFALVELEDDEIIVDSGLFFACEEGIEVDAAMQDTISSVVLGNEGLFQTRIKGDGIVALKVPVPETEIFKCVLVDDVLKIDGDLAILRTGNIDFSVEKSSRSAIGSATNGEGFVNVYRGTGEVWIVPTRNVYDKLEKEGIESVIENDREDKKE